MSRGKKFDLVSIGDSTHDTFVQLEEASIQCSVDKKKCLLCLSWADKIPARKVTQVPGVGNAANAAVGAARLGLKTAFYTHVGDDALGRDTVDVFKQAGVILDYVTVTKNLPSNHHLVLNYGAERTIIVYHEPWPYKLPRDLNAKWLYFSSLAPAHQKLHSQIASLVKKNDAKLAFQPGTFQLREGKSRLKPILQVSEVILLNKEEGQIVTGLKSSKPKKLMSALHKLGPRIVVMTDGPKGAYVYNGVNAYYSKIFPLPAKERTGAGDAFSIGFVGALAKGKDIEEALLWGNANSTSVVQYVGAQEGLLSEAGIKKMIKRFNKIKPKKI